MRAPVLLLLCLALALAVQAGTPIAELLPNGFRVVSQPTTSAQVVSMTLLVNYSALDEPYEFAGLRQVVLLSMLYGSETKDGPAIRKMLGAIGGSLEGRVHQDVLEFTVRVPAGYAHQAISALAEVVAKPKLADASIQAAIDQATQQLQSPPVGALACAERVTQRALYQRHSYSSGSRGSLFGLSHITPAAVRWAYNTYVGPHAAVLAIVGRCKAEDVVPLVRAAFSAWQERPMPPRGFWEPPALDTSLVVLREEPVKSTCVMMAFPTPGILHEDFLTLRLIETLLAGGTGARLFRSVRQEQHLAYEVSVQFPSQVACSHFALYALTTARYMEETRQALASELEHLQVDAVPERELQRARAYLKNRYLVNHQYSSQYAFDLAWYTVQGLGTQYDAGFATAIDRISAADVQRVAREVFTHYLCTVVTPQQFEEAPKQEASLKGLKNGVTQQYLVEDRRW